MVGILLCLNLSALVPIFRQTRLERVYMARQSPSYNTRVCPRHPILGVLLKHLASPLVYAITPDAQQEVSAIQFIVSVAVMQTAWVVFWPVNTHLNAPPLENVLLALPTPPFQRVPSVLVPRMGIGAQGQACVTHI